MKYTLTKYTKVGMLLAALIFSPNSQAVFSGLPGTDEMKESIQVTGTFVRIHLTTDVIDVGIRYMVSKGFLEQSHETAFEYPRMITLGLYAASSIYSLYKCYNIVGDSNTDKYFPKARNIFLLGLVHKVADCIELPAHLGWIPTTFINSTVAPAVAITSAIGLVYLINKEKKYKGY